MPGIWGRRDSGAEDCRDGGVEFGGGGGDDGLGGIGGVAVPVGDGAAGTANDGDKGGDVPGIHDGVDTDIDKPGGQEEVAVTVGPRAIEAAGVDETIRGGGVLIAREIAVVAGHEGGFG